MKTKMEMKFIEDKKSRNLTFKRRKEGLIKKIKELTTLCDVDGCMIIYSSDHDAPDIVWPPDDPGQAHRLIDIYRAKKVQDCIFHNKQGDDEEVLKKKRVELLREFVALQNKTQIVKSRLGELRKKKILQMNIDGSSMNQDLSTCSSYDNNRVGLIDHCNLDQFGLNTVDFDSLMHNSSSLFQDSSTTMMMPRLQMDQDSSTAVMMSRTPMDVDGSSMYQDSSTTVMTSMPMPVDGNVNDSSTIDDDLSWCAGTRLDDVGINDAGTSSTLADELYSFFNNDDGSNNLDYWASAGTLAPMEPQTDDHVMLNQGVDDISRYFVC